MSAGTNADPRPGGCACYVQACCITAQRWWGLNHLRPPARYGSDRSRGSRASLQSPNFLPICTGNLTYFILDNILLQFRILGRRMTPSFWGLKIGHRFTPPPPRPLRVVLQQTQRVFHRVQVLGGGSPAPPPLHVKPAAARLAGTSPTPSSPSAAATSRCRGPSCPSPAWTRWASRCTAAPPCRGRAPGGPPRTPAP